MPPLDHVLEVLLNAVLPPAILAAALTALVAWVGRRRDAIVYLGSALGLAAGGALGNWLCGALPVTGMPTVAWHWLPWVTLAALTTGVVAAGPTVPVGVGWSLRGMVAGHASWLLTPAELRTEHFWVPLLVGAVVLAEWAVLEQLKWGGFAALAMSLTAVTGAVVLIHAGSRRFFDLAMILGGALAGIAVAALPMRVHTRGVAPAVAVIVPALLLSGWYETYSEVPWSSFTLAALSPLSLAPSLWPAWQRHQKKGLWAVQSLLFLACLAGAIALAAMHESLDYE
jgi:hypothetical protein